jgi:DNA-binding PadR family transcriptional regulator
MGVHARARVRPPIYYALRYYVLRSTIRNMAPSTRDTVQRSGRTNDATALILTSLADGPRHGYALVQDIEAFAGVTLGPGTLYGAISRLERRGLIEAVGPDGRKRPYRLTAAGAEALQSMLAELRMIVDEGTARLAQARQGATALGTA